MDLKLLQELEKAFAAIETARDMIGRKTDKSSSPTHTDARITPLPALWKRPRQHLFVYIAGCRGLANLTAQSGDAIFQSLGIAGEPYVVKIGTTTVDVETRLRYLGADRVGSYVRRDDGTLAADHGFSRWIPHMVTTSRDARDPRIGIHARYISIALPRGVTSRSFDAALHRALRDRALDRVPPQVLRPRLNQFDMIKPRVNRSTELYAYCPHDPSAGDWLLGAIERVLVKHEIGT